MRNIWEYMQKVNPYARHHIIAIVRSMSKGYTHCELQAQPEDVVALRELGLTVIVERGTLCKVHWGKTGFENNDPGYIPTAAEKRVAEQKAKRKAKPKKEPSDDAVWLQYARTITGDDVVQNKHGIGRVVK
ncbi:hypothetical protein LGW72_10050 [Streptococcus mutans]|nr:hypothetical protein [Streptococcus mutans]MCB5007525.1 hypothetical protein [Streptococcus mutans]MCB5030032.1 hypothetical protein [Streptococcus mutans]MCB5100704.1 hypothetical protein [Streptococcus mutans]